MTAFALHPQLASDTLDVCRLSLCCVLLMNDRSYPWVILVPERPDLREIHALSGEEQQLLMADISLVSKVLEGFFDADKMNVAALGNMVPQLHIHIICRYKDDPAWPDPVWGKVPAVPYSEAAAGALVAKLRMLLLER